MGTEISSVEVAITTLLGLPDFDTTVAVWNVTQKTLWPECRGVKEGATVKAFFYVRREGCVGQPWLEVVNVPAQAGQMMLYEPARSA